METLKNNVRYLREFREFEVLLKDHFKFEWQTFVFIEELQELRLNAMLPKEDQPIVVDQEEGSIRF